MKSSRAIFVPFHLSANERRLWNHFLDELIQVIWNEVDDIDSRQVELYQERQTYLVQSRPSLPDRR
jgi:hypothetical protein